MIHAAVSHIANQLNQFLKVSFDLSEDVVVMSGILEQDGTVSPAVGNKLVLFLVNVEKETTLSMRPQAGSSAATAITPQPLALNLYVMLAANFNSANYAEALKFLSNAISFFQRQPVFDHQATPGMDERIDRLVLDIENLNVQDLSSMWGMLSGKYLPSVLYRVRVVTFDARDIRGRLSPIVGHQASVG